MVGNKRGCRNRKNQGTHAVCRQRETLVVPWTGVGSGGKGRMESSTWPWDGDDRGNKGRGRDRLTGNEMGAICNIEESEEDSVSKQGWEAMRGDRRRPLARAGWIGKNRGRKGCIRSLAERPQFPREQFLCSSFDMETVRVPPNYGGPLPGSPGGGARSELLERRKRQLPPGSAGTSCFCLDWHLGMY